MPEAEPATRPRTARDPQALSSEYHKARKQLMLWAGILFIWELVGIDLEKAKEAGGNAGAIITSIRSPQAVPWVLLILVAYFLFKTTVEWHQCSGSRRALRVSKIDFGSAWIITVLAYALYAYQAISRIQFADVVQGSNRGQSVMFAVGSGLACVVFIKVVLRRKSFFISENKLAGMLGAMVPFLSLLSLVLGIIQGTLNWRYIAIGIPIGAVLGLLTMYLLDRTFGVSKA